MTSQPSAEPDSAGTAGPVAVHGSAAWVAAEPVDPPVEQQAEPVDPPVEQQAEPVDPPAERVEQPTDPAEPGWRRRRPFWAGLFVTLAGVEILLTMMAPLPVIIHLGVQGLAGYLVPVILVLCGQLLWWNPSQRLFYSILALIMSLAAWVTSNLGGFFLGIILGLIGGSAAFAWKDPFTDETARSHRPGGRRGRRR